MKVKWGGGGLDFHRVCCTLRQNTPTTQQGPRNLPFISNKKPQSPLAGTLSSIQGGDRKRGGEREGGGEERRRGRKSGGAHKEHDGV